MPELPEVQTVVDGISPIIVGEVIQDVWISQFKLRKPPQADIYQKVVGQKIKDVSRRAKYIALHLDVDLIIHLGMSGKLTIENSDYHHKKHDHVILYLTNCCLVFNDPRRFGMFFWHESITQYLSHYGVEPLSDAFNTEYLQQDLSKRSSTIKQRIMDQDCVVGIGNIYACEALFDAKVSPLRSASSLSKSECEKLVTSIKTILNRAIHAGGTTLKDYRNANNEHGYFQQRLCVYGREGQLCESCSHHISQSRQGGRSTFFCSFCQR
jgi:formamidopyrimidine-DNA glycosylase